MPRSSKPRTLPNHGRDGGSIRPRGSSSQHELEQRYRAAADARPTMVSLDGCEVTEITFQQAATIILPYEWWGTMGNTRLHYGLWSPDGDLIGAECLGGLYNVNPLVGESLAPRPNLKLGAAPLEMILQRGACVYWKPEGAPSFLIKRALRLAFRDHQVEVVRAYADVRAGEIGQIYQYLGWHYLGRGRGHGENRIEWHIPDTPDDQWVSSRMLEHRGFKGKGAWKRARKKGWVSRPAPAKHEYVRLEGPRVGEMLRLLTSLPYPTR